MSGFCAAKFVSFLRVVIEGAIALPLFNCLKEIGGGPRMVGFFRTEVFKWCGMSEVK